MVKILSQSGSSLADIYEAEGSIAGIDQLDTRELPIVHEMGQTVFSERWRTSIRRTASGAIAQNITFDNSIADLPAVPTRLLGVAVFSDVASRISQAALVGRDADAGREFPLWVYDGEGGASFTTVRMVDDGGAAGNVQLLHGRASNDFLPNFVGGSGQRSSTIVDRIVLRGLTTGFGAGTVFIRGLYYIASSGAAGTLDSRGLPIPSW